MAALMNRNYTFNQVATIAVGALVIVPVFKTVSSKLWKLLKPPMKYGYWNLRGLGQSVRFMLEYTGEKYDETRYEVSRYKEWFEEDKKNLGIELANLPYIIDGPLKISQSVAILRYIARKNGLAGKSIADQAKVDMVCDFIGDFRRNYSKVAYTDMRDEKLKQKFFKDTVPTFLNQLSEQLGEEDWFVGNLTMADFLVYEMLDVVRIMTTKVMGSNALEAKENLMQFMTRFEQLPAIAKYMTSENFVVRPLNGPSAMFNT
uniref:glutathione transferase n=1 Tax=Fibrocapsa japonica TaxID=94617 RepID=A0A7S2XUX3_9STRA|eukprot:CAMPEP_0113938638 /NCGR_PEP_ID=MMETSP1339-20121228/5062_1 /TAXON_ID=94617 /ORGANISM="Fibrocapsa japonica" /LENGTH=259 /DNA_ID=CAMNT_0000941853 /DNA_START=67 /DNA_END=846 /DNA_ORIENTATION=- /assembly_acc=CAM_ASM_000762